MLPDETHDVPLDSVDDGKPGPVRTCILTRVHGERGAYVRLVIGPDGAVWPDLAGRLPGRGAWIAPSRDALAAAVAKRKLGGLMARAFRTPPPTVPDDLADRIEQGLMQRLLSRLGLEHRAGAIMFGSDRLSDAARAGKLQLMLHAADAAADGTGKLEQAMRVGGGRPGIRLAVPRDALSAALGRDNSVHLGVTTHQAAARILEDVVRLHRWLSIEDGSGIGSDRPDRTKAEGSE